MAMIAWVFAAKNKYDFSIRKLREIILEHFFKLLLYLEKIEFNLLTVVVLYPQYQYLVIYLDDNFNVLIAQNQWNFKRRDPSINRFLSIIQNILNYLEQYFEVRNLFLSKLYKVWQKGLIQKL